MKKFVVDIKICHNCGGGKEVYLVDAYNSRDAILKVCQYRYDNETYKTKYATFITAQRYRENRIKGGLQDLPTIILH